MVEYTALDPTLHALADPTRRAILARLAEGEARVTDVAAPFPCSLNAVSKHIRVLESGDRSPAPAACGSRTLAGTLNPEPLSAASAWIEELRALWTWRLAELDRILKETIP